ncbi:hypothetical protein [Flavobacterium sp.]|uniref:hypothetical protein n=1 Tax=Flavobacterium sp. TaxID=239 RepID=UPI0037505DE9
MRIKIFLSLVLVMISFCNCESGIQRETQKRILSHKQFIKEFSFEGIVVDMIYCSECNFNKYRIKIKINEAITNKIEFDNLAFEPYYSTSTNDTLTLSVSKKLYDATQKGIQINKKASSNDLSIEGKDYKLLSQEKYQWIP